MDCCNNETVRSVEERKSLTNRLSRIEGQIRGLRAMVEEDKYCGDILVQSSAVMKAIGAFSRQILDTHVKRCVVHGVQEGKEEIVDELIGLVHKFMR